MALKMFTRQVMRLNPSIDDLERVSEVWAEKVEFGETSEVIKRRLVARDMRFGLRIPGGMTETQIRTAPFLSKIDDSTAC